MGIINALCGSSTQADIITVLSSIVIHEPYIVRAMMDDLYNSLSYLAIV